MNRPSKNNSRFLLAGDSALVIQFGEVVDAAINQNVRKLAAIVKRENINGILDLVPTMRSLMIHYDPLCVSQSELKKRIAPLLGKGITLDDDINRWRIPVCYENEYAPDIEEVSKSLGVSASEIIKQHTSVELEVFMMGFLPGFPYLGLLPEIFDLPRRVEPRVHVPPRSISVAARQTTIYTIDSPGGWHLIGQTPVDFYHRGRRNPVLVKAGDKVTFFAINSEEYPSVRRALMADEYPLMMDC